MDTQATESALIHELNRLLTKYENRIQANHGTQHSHISKKDAIKMVDIGATIGGAIGTAIPVPIAGNAIGAAAGAALALGIAGVIEAYNQRNNKKVDNAASVSNHLNDKTKDWLIREAAHQVIQDRTAMLNNLRETASNRTAVTKYLAANMMSALKYAGGNSRSAADIMANGVQNTYSKKVSSQQLSTNNNQDLSLRELARNQDNGKVRRSR